jgi:hypothetical protein
MPSMISRRNDPPARGKLQTAMLIAAGLVHGGCSAGEPDGNSPSVEQGRTVQEGNAVPTTGPALVQERILISSDRGELTAELADNEASRRLVQMLPIAIEMRDHLRQEKTGRLPAPLPELPRQTGFSAGTLGLWGNDDLVIYYRNGRVPQPGIIVLGRVTGDLSILDRPGPVSVRIQRITEAGEQR